MRGSVNNKLKMNYNQSIYFFNKEKTTTIKN